jgi:hypothetical protein
MPTQYTDLAPRLPHEMARLCELDRAGKFEEAETLLKRFEASVAPSQVSPKFREFVRNGRTRGDRRYRDEIDAKGNVRSFWATLAERRPHLNKLDWTARYRVRHFIAFGDLGAAFRELQGAGGSLWADESGDYAPLVQFMRSLGRHSTETDGHCIAPLPTR